MILTTLHEPLPGGWRERPLIRADFEALGQAIKNPRVQTLRIRQALSQFFSTPATAINRTRTPGNFHLFDIIHAAKQRIEVQTRHALIGDQQLMSGNIGIDVTGAATEG